jgi:serine/threonine protein kinase
MVIEGGTERGRYEIRSPIGAGGMGEVYRASDPKINREVQAVSDEKRNAQSKVVEMLLPGISRAVR